MLHPPEQEILGLSTTEKATVAALVAGTYAGSLTITGNLQVDGTTVLQSTTTVAGVAKFADGAVGAPSVTFATDLTAGLYHTGTGATGKILAAINGADVLTLTSVGLGIGSSLPDSLTQKLYVRAGNALFNAGYGVVFSNAGSEAAGGGFVKNSANNFLQLAGANGVNVQGQLKVGAAAGAGETPLAALHVVQVAAPSGVPKAFLLTSGAHTGLTTTAEDIGVLFDLSATKTWATGNIATQREFVINAPTYAFASASTITSAATVYISGAPIAGENATITNPAALVVASGNVGFGTPNPGYKLVVTGTGLWSAGASATLSLNESGVRQWSFSAGGIVSGDLNIINGSDSMSKLTIQGSTGNVGIGTPTPVGMVSIVSEAVAGMPPSWSSKYAVFGPNAGSVSGAALGIGFSNTTGANLVSSAPGVSWQPLLIACSAFSVLGNGSVLGLAQNSTGLVGIGTTNPSQRLDVNGNVILQNGNTGLSSYPYVKLFDTSIGAYMQGVTTDTFLTVNAVTADGTNWTRDNTNYGSLMLRLRSVTGGASASGRVDLFQQVKGAGTFTLPSASFSLDENGNFCVGATAAGTTAAKCLALTNSATAPTASADLVHLYSADIAADRATLATWSEEAPAADVGLSSTHSYIEFINGAKYKRMLVAVA